MRRPESQSPSATQMMGELNIFNGETAATWDKPNHTLFGYVRTTHASKIKGRDSKSLHGDIGVGSGLGSGSSGCLAPFAAPFGSSCMRATAPCFSGTATYCIFSGMWKTCGWEDKEMTGLFNRGL